MTSNARSAFIALMRFRLIWSASRSGRSVFGGWVLANIVMEIIKGNFSAPCLPFQDAGVMRLVVEVFLDHSRQTAEQAIAFAAVGRSVHDGSLAFASHGELLLARRENLCRYS